MLKGTLILLIVALAVSIGTPLTGQQVESALTLPLVESPPAFGTFYLTQNHVPYPFDPSFGQHPVYQLRPGIFLVDDSQFNANPLSARDGMAVSPTLTIIDFLPPPCDSCGTNSDAGGPFNWGGNYDHPSNALWLQIAGVISNAAYLVIHTPTNTANDLFFTSALTTNGSALNSTNWAWLGRVAPGETNVVVPDLWSAEGCFQLGTMDDADNDSLTDAYEQFVSHSSLTNPNSPQAIYENVLSNQNPSGWFKLNDGLLTNAIYGRASLTNAGGGFENDVFATAYGAYSFANSSDRLVLGETDDAIGGGTNDAATQGSFTLLFKTLTIRTTAKRYLLSQGSSTGTSGNAIAVYFDGTNSTDAALTGALRLGVGPNEQAILLDSNIVRGAWYYLAVTCDETRDSNEVRWYLGQVGSPTLQSSSFSLGQAKKFGTDGPITIGNRDVSAPTSAFRQSSSIKGVIDQVAFWERELSSTEINAQFNTLDALSQGPSTIFDLTRWELTLPVDETNQLDNTHKPLDISTAWLNSRFKYVDPADSTQKYFYLSTGSQMVFEAPWNGADQDTASPSTSLGSPRSELRETLANGGEHNWAPNSEGGIHTLQASCKVTGGTNKVIIGQIHAKTPTPTNGTGAVPAVILSHNPSNGVVTVTIKHSPYDKDADTAYNFPTSVPLAGTIDYTLQMLGVGTNVTLNATVNNQLIPIEMTQAPYDTAWGNTNVTLYFKAGCYYPKAPNNSSTAKVKFSSLVVTPHP